MLKGAAEFYRNFPNVKKGADGKYHIHNVNSNESIYGARDTDEDVSAMYGVTAAALRAAAILQVDADLQAKWREFLANLTPLATSDDADALKPDGYAGARVFVRGRKPAIKPGGFTPDGNSLPMWLFDLCNSGRKSRDGERHIQRRAAQWRGAADHGAGALEDGDCGGATGAGGRGAVHDSGAD